LLDELIRRTGPIKPSAVGRFHRSSSLNIEKREKKKKNHYSLHGENTNDGQGGCKRGEEKGVLKGERDSRKKKRASTSPV